MARRAWRFGLRVAASVLLLGASAWLLRGSWRPPAGFDPPPALGALALVLLLVQLAIWRWSLLLRRAGGAVRPSRLAFLYYAGTGLTALVPSAIATDAVRVGLVARETKTPAPAVGGSLVLDRLVYLAVVLGATALTSRAWLGPYAGWAVAAGAVLAALAAPLAWRHARRHPEGAVASAFAVWRGPGRVGALACTAALAALYLVGTAGVLLLVAAALGIALAPTTALAVAPPLALASLLPVGIQGIGVREAAFVALLAPLGVPASSALQMGLGTSTLQLVQVALGLGAAGILTMGWRHAGRDEDAATLPGLQDGRAPP